MTRLKPFLSVYGPWIALYIVLFAGASVFGATVYHKYEQRHLRVPGSVLLVVSKTRYQLGEPIAFTVTNHFSVPIYVINTCPKEPLDVYRWENNAWKQLHAIARDESECREQERDVAIPPEGQRTYDFDDWPTLFDRPGVYRIATKIDHYDDIPFQDFVILEPAKVINVEASAAQPAPTPTPIVRPAPIEAIAPTIRLDELSADDEEWEHEYEDERDDD